MSSVSARAGVPRRVGDSGCSPSFHHTSHPMVMIHQDDERQEVRYEEVPEIRASWS
jgi:hypothetical protein